MPDADLESTTQIVTDSVFGNAGQRCLAASLVITVGEAHQIFTSALQEAAASRIVGNGFDENVQMGPVISPQSRDRISGLIWVSPIFDRRYPLRQFYLWGIRFWQ